MKRIPLALSLSVLAAWTPRASAEDFEGVFESHLTVPSSPSPTFRSFRLQLSSGATKQLVFHAGSAQWPGIPEARALLILQVATSPRLQTIRFTNVVRDPGTSSERYLVWRDSDFLAFGGRGEPRRGFNYQTPTAGIATSINVWGDLSYWGEYMVIRTWNDTYQLVWMNTNANWDIGRGYGLVPAGYLNEAFLLAAHAGYLQMSNLPQSHSPGWRVFHAGSTIAGSRQ